MTGPDGTEGTGRANMTDTERTERAGESNVTIVGVFDDIRRRAP